MRLTETIEKYKHILRSSNQSYKANKCQKGRSIHNQLANGNSSPQSGRTRIGIATSTRPDPSGARSSARGDAVATDEQPPLPAQPYPAQSQAAGAAAAPAQAQQQQQLDEGWQPAGRGDRGAKRKRKAAKKQLAQQGELPRQNAQQQQPPQQNQQPAAARKGIFAQLNSFGLRTHFGADPNVVTEVCDCICQMSYTNQQPDC